MSKFREFALPKFAANSNIYIRKILPVIGLNTSEVNSSLWHLAS